MNGFDTIITHKARWWSNTGDARLPIVTMEYDVITGGSIFPIEWQKSALTVGIDEVTNTVNTISYPNPTKDAITITAPSINIGSIVVMDITGKMVKSEPFRDEKITLNVSKLDNGVYVYNIYDVGGNIVHSSKFIVAK